MKRKPDGFIPPFFLYKKKWRIRLRPSGLRRDKERGIRHERSEVSASIADRRSRSAGQPIKKSRFLRHAESCNVKMKKLKSKFTCDLEFYYFYSDFLSTAWKRAKKMAEKEGFEPSESCPSAVFKTAALNHSTISPRCFYKILPLLHFYNPGKRKFFNFDTRSLYLQQKQRFPGGLNHFCFIADKAFQFHIVTAAEFFY